jgi:DNA-binding IscR family transcriptional regulator
MNVTEPCIELTDDVRREAVITTLCRRPEITLGQLEELARSDEYASVLEQITVADLWETRELGPRRRPDDDLEEAALRIFEWHPSQWLASSVFVQRLGIPRWTVLSVLSSLCERGLVERKGNTSATRYRLRADSATTRRTA